MSHYTVQDDGWKEEAFEDVLFTLDELASICYEIRMCQRTMEPEEMIDKLVELATELKEQSEHLR